MPELPTILALDHHTVKRIGDENFAVIANGKVVKDGSKTDAACWLWVSKCKRRKGRRFATADVRQAIEELWHTNFDQSRAMH